MPNNRNLVGLFALSALLLAVLSAPAAAEFFGCNDTRGQVLYSYGGGPTQYSSRSSTRHSTRDYSTQPTRRHASRDYTTDYSSRRSNYDRSQW